MIKLFLILAMALNCAFIYSQDFSRFRSMTKTESADFATEITNGNREPLMLWRARENDRKLSFVYIPKSTDTIALNIKMKKGVDLGVKFDYIDFEIIYEGRNKDLEIEGTRKYQFFQATLKLIDLFPIWKKYFNPNATLQGITTDYDMKTARYKEGTIDWIYKFERTNSPYWTLSKFY